MLHLLSLTGEPNAKHYLLMNGDLVDRGSWSIEVILTAFAYKCEIRCDHHVDKQRLLLTGLYPNYMFINRGNHETKDMNRTYGFEGEAKHKHGEQSYKVCLIGTLPEVPLVERHALHQLFAHVFTTCELL